MGPGAFKDRVSGAPVANDPEQRYYLWDRFSSA